MSPKRCAYLTMDDETGWQIDSELAFAPLAELGWEIEALPWRADDVDWTRFDAVYVGTPWDYPEDPDRLLQQLTDADNAGAVVVNDVALVRWNLAKTYLRDLEMRGADIVPSLYFEGMSEARLAGAFRKFRAPSVIVKPVVSTNATDTFLLARDGWRAELEVLKRTFDGRGTIVQPFISGIRDEGEFSLFFFSQQFSHAICKVPKSGDFRVQEEFGAEIVAVVPEPALREAGERVLELVEPAPVYARADFVRGVDGRFLLMELELIEPSLYLRMDAAAPGRFAAAFDEYVRTNSGGDES